MLATDKDALFCDLAETYHVLDWRALPVQTVATLADGLPPDCRVRRKMSGIAVSFSELLLAVIVDRLSDLIWMNSKDGQRGKNRPKSLAQTLISKEAKKREDITVYSTPEAFEEARRKMMRGAKQNA